jgi:hypothetical protein
MCPVERVTRKRVAVGNRMHALKAIKIRIKTADSVHP